jgi:seryl-tRNA synthetase
MLDIRTIRDNPDLVKAAVANRKLSVDIDRLLAVDEARRKLQTELDQLKSEQNQASKAIAQAAGDERQAMIAAMSSTKERAKALEEELAATLVHWTELMKQVPNIPLSHVPVGLSEEENVVARTWGTPRTFDFPVRDHMALGKHLDVIDVEQAAIVSGSRFAYLKGDAVRLQMALISLVFDQLGDERVIASVSKEAGLTQISTKPFVPVLPPVIMRRDVMDRMDRLHPSDQRYQLPEDDQVFVGSAEHTLGPYYMDHTFDVGQLPIRFIGYSTAFRREAGTYGKDMGGILRVHQFDKLEMETFATADTGEDEQKLIVALQEHLTRLVEVPYQVIQKCTFDIGKPNANGLDIECWMPGQGRFRETHTSDYMTDYQARRLDTFYKTVDGKRQHVHMNDATAFAIGRILIAILENHQQADGSVLIPTALRPYMGGQEKIVPRG